jgi:predicted RNA-binding Zn-ribbon protein involved in translation (DUF1610 family)
MNPRNPLRLAEKEERIERELTRLAQAYTLLADLSVEEQRRILAWLKDRFDQEAYEIPLSEAREDRAAPEAIRLSEAQDCAACGERFRATAARCPACGKRRAQAEEQARPHEEETP